MDGKRLSKAEEITQQVQEIKSRSVTAKLIRNGKPETIEVVPEKVAFATTIGATDSPYFVLDSSESIPNGWWRTLRVTGQLQDGNTELVLIPRIARTATDKIGTEAGITTPKDPLAQISALKQQLGEMQKLLATLEASLATAEQKPTPPPSDEKK